MNHTLSIVVVNDYVTLPSRSQADLVRALRSIARLVRDRGDVEVIVAASHGDALDLSVLQACVPSVSVHRFEVETSYGLKNAGVACARGRWVCLLDGDCTPGPSWLDGVFSVIAAHPELAAASGRTRYVGESLSERALALISRSYVDAARHAPVTHISNNNVVYAKEVYLRFPLPTDCGPFASGVQARALLNARHALFFEPKMEVTHVFEGWKMEADIRRNLGWATFHLRVRHPELPHAWVTALGPAVIPLLVAARTAKVTARLPHVARAYGLRPWEWPAVMALAGLVHMMEVPGMLRALRGQPPPDGAYR